jgi:hypothetical protein
LPARVADVRLKACADRSVIPITLPISLNHRDQLPSSVPDVDVNIKPVYGALGSGPFSITICSLLASTILNSSIACLESGTTIGFSGF